MRLSIDVETIDDGWILRYRPEGQQLVTRQLAFRGESGSRFPIPPSHESAAWEEKEHASFCDAADTIALERALRRIVLGTADSLTRKTFGNYLTAALLGPHLDVLTALPAAEPVELYLRLGPDRDLQRLPWELLYGGEEPLAASAARTFAVVRVVPGAAAGPEPIPLALPLSVLFVVGQSLDEALRPGAEYMALVRRIAGPEGDLRVANMNSRLLLRATADDLRKAIDDLHPAVVHFICHGDFDGEATLLLTSSDKKQPDTPQSLSAPQLLELLRGESQQAPLPSAIVLNACHTADAAQSPDRKNAYRSFAATLVEGGVPMVLGMAGEVADGACRVFTCELYQALLSGESVVLASGRGRRAALRGYGGYRETSEWARPTLFVAGEETAARTLDRRNESLGDAAALFIEQTDPRALCGRLACIKEFEALLRRVLARNGKRFVLGYGVSAPTAMHDDGHTPKYGKTRTLEELAVRFALAGVAPVLLHRERNTHVPTHPLDFVLTLSELMNVTRNRFKAPARLPTATMEFIVERFELGPPMTPGQKPPSLVLEKLKTAAKDHGKEVTDDAVQDLLGCELALLLDDVKAASPGVSHVAVLIDDLPAYEGCAMPLLSMLGDLGLGQGNDIVPLVFTYVRHDTAGPDIADFLKRKGHPDITLGPFDEEEALAHRLFLLTRRNQPLAITNQPVLAANAPKLFRRISTITSGIPSRWETDKFRELLAYYHEDFAVLVDADDERVMETYGGD